MVQVMNKEQEDAKALGIMNLSEYAEVQRKMEAKAALAEVPPPPLTELLPTYRCRRPGSGSWALH